MFLSETNPIVAADRLTAIENAFTTALIGINPQVLSSANTIAALTVAQLSSDLLIFTGGTVVTATLPTAAALVAAIPGAAVNTGIALTLRNNNSGTVTLAVTTGGTSYTSNTLTFISLHTKGIRIQFTNVTSGSEAFTLFTTYDSAS